MIALLPGLMWGGGKEPGTHGLHLWKVPWYRLSGIISASEELSVYTVFMSLSTHTFIVPFQTGGLEQIYVN